MAYEMLGLFVIVTLCLFVNADAARCVRSGDEMCCRNVTDCTLLRNYTGSSVTRLRLDESCQRIPLHQDDLGAFANISRLELVNTSIEMDILEKLKNLTYLVVTNCSVPLLSAKTYNWIVASVVENRKGLRYDVQNLHSYLTYVWQLRTRKKPFGGFEPGSLQNNSRLRSLDLGHNGIVELKRGSFCSSCSSLHSLTLSYNNISKIESGSFANCSQMRELYLDNNRLVSLEERDLYGLTSLDLLDVSNNSLQTLDASIVASMELGLVNASNNRIATFGPELVDAARISRVDVDLQGNPLSCVCGGPLEQVYKLNLIFSFFCDNGQLWDVLAACSQEPDQAEDENDDEDEDEDEDYPQTQVPNSAATSVNPYDDDSLDDDYSVEFRSASVDFPEANSRSVSPSEMPDITPPLSQDNVFIATIVVIAVFVYVVLAGFYVMYALSVRASQKVNSNSGRTRLVPVWRRESVDQGGAEESSFTLTSSQL